MGSSVIKQDVIQSDAFLKLSDSAQALYYQLLCSSDSFGVLSNTFSSLCAARKTEESLNELTSAGFVIDLRDEKQVCVIAHYWILNKWDKSNRTTSFPEVISNYLCFVGESKLYRLQSNVQAKAAPTGEIRHKYVPVWFQTDGRLKPVRNLINGIEKNPNEIENKKNETEWKGTPIESPYPAGAVAKPDKCPKCHETAEIALDGNNWIILCPRCGTTKVNKETGEETQLSDKPQTE